ncbi:MAG: hypothetical protein BHV75_05035 [Bacteroides oleiciplenus]|nr:MAG: hypothetical protein BHV75_05035 [Bacteroides oleiciplenus]
MENIPVTAYSGFSNVRGEITLRKVIENITKGLHARLVFKIRMLVSQGKTEEANNVKKQLPFYTVTATYRQKRQAYSMTGYTRVILLERKSTEIQTRSPLSSLQKDTGSSSSYS